MGNTIFKATLDGDLNTIMQCVDENSSTILLEKTQCGKLPIHLAALNGHIDIVKYILDIDPTLVDERDREGNNVLHWACFKGDLNLVMYLVQEQEPYLLIQKNNYDEQPLDWAKHWDKEDVIEYLENCPDPPPIQCSSHNNDNSNNNSPSKTSSSSSLSSSPSKIGNAIKNAFGRRRSESNSQIFKAVRSGDYQQVKRLIKVDQSCLTEKLRCGKTPLHVASQKGHLSIVKFIAKTDPTLVPIKDKRGWTALHWACWNGRFDVVEYMACHESPDLLLDKDTSGDTPLHVACYNHQLDVAKYLVQRNPALMGETNNNGVTPYGRVKQFQKHIPSVSTSPQKKE